MPSSYTHYLETSKITGNLEKLKFDELREMLAQHDKNFGKKKQVGEDVFFIEASTSKYSTKNSRGRGRGNNNQNQGAYIGQGHGWSQERGNKFKKCNNQG